MKKLLFILILLSLSFFVSAKDTNSTNTTILDSEKLDKISIDTDYLKELNVEIARIISTPKLQVFGTEYLEGETVRAWLILTDSENYPLNTGDCYLSAFSPNNTMDIFVNNSPMTNKGTDGIYYLDFNTTELGVYALSGKCELGEISLQAYGTQLLNGTVINGTLSNTQILDSSYTKIQGDNVGTTSSNRELANPYTTKGTDCAATSTNNPAQGCLLSIDDSNSTAPQSAWVTNGIGSTGANLSIWFNTTYTYNVTNVQILTYPASIYYQTYQLYYSDDNSTWTFIQGITGNTQNTRLLNVSLANGHRFWKLFVASPVGDGNYGYDTYTGLYGTIITGTGKLINLISNYSLTQTYSHIEDYRIQLQAYNEVNNGNYSIYLFNYSSKKYVNIVNFTVNTSVNLNEYDYTLSASNTDFLNSTLANSGVFSLLLNSSDNNNFFYVDYFGLSLLDLDNHSIAVKGGGEAHISAVNSEIQQISVDLSNVEETQNLLSKLIKYIIYILEKIFGWLL